LPYENVNRYNGDGQRIRTGDGYGARYYYIGQALFFTMDGVGAKTGENILTPDGRVIAQRRASEGNEFYFYHYDMRGSVTNIVGTETENGQTQVKLVQGYDYDVFGETTELKPGEFGNEQKYTGAVYEESLGIYYMNARHYDPSTGRFLQQDTYKGNGYSPRTQHLYAYTSNDPVNMIDPTGHSGEPYLRQGRYWGSDIVKTLQTMLNRYGYGLAVDGKFGPKTDAAGKVSVTTYDRTGAVVKEKKGMIGNDKRNKF